MLHFMVGGVESLAHSLGPGDALKIHGHTAHEHSNPNHEPARFTGAGHQKNDPLVIRQRTTAEIPPWSLAITAMLLTQL